MPLRPTLRPATLADAPGIARVHVDAWREAYRGIVPDEFLAQLSVERREAQWRSFLGKPQPGDCLHIALDGERIVGFVNAGRSRSPELPYSAEIFAIYLLQAYQGRGSGAALFGLAARDQLAQGRDTLMLWVLADNPTVGFYRHLGGVAVAEKTEDIGGKPLKELALGWSPAALSSAGSRAPSA
jgi:GNAT superfamily N-acetyltransferase